MSTAETERQGPIAVDPGRPPDRVWMGWSIGRGWKSDVVAACDRIVDEDGGWQRSPWSHTFWVFRWMPSPALLWESMVGRGIRLMPLSRLETSEDVERYEYVPMDLEPAQRRDLWEACCALSGRAYDWQHCIRLYVYIWVWGRGSVRQPWWLRLGTDDRYHCAEAVETTGRMVGLDLNYGNGRQWATPATVTPHSLWRAQRPIPVADVSGDVVTAGAL